MNGRVGIRHRLAAILAAIPLLLALALAWQIRPPLPPLPHSLRAPFPAGSGTATLHLLAWAVFVLLDLALWLRVLEYGSRRKPTDTELRLQRALHRPTTPASARPPDWRVHTAPPTQPVMRLPAATAATQERPTTRPQPAPAIAEQEPAQSLHAEAVASRPERVGLRLLGPLELTGCKKTRPRRQATRELLAFLALQHGLVSRQELIEALWPGEEPRRSAERFNQAATEARRLLGDAFQRRAANHYQLDRRHLDIDLDQLEQLHQGARDRDGGQQPALLERALALFRGEPFAGIDALWADAEARRLRALQSELLDQLGRLRLGAGDATGALAAAEHAAMLDRSNERPVQLAMEAEAALGQRDAIVERYERLCHDLDEQYGLGPSRESKQLYRRLLSQDGAAAEQTTVREQAPR
jgi:DNA-binding SARP family transcriptional activator